MAADDGEHGVGDEDKAHRQHRLDVLVEEPQRDDDEKPREVVGVRHSRGAQLRRHKDAMDKTLAVNKVPTADNLADMFTKALDRDPFTKLRKLVMNIMIMGVKAPVPRARRIAASRGA
jgi:hypothetical protein